MIKYRSHLRFIYLFLIRSCKLEELQYIKNRIYKFTSINEYKAKSVIKNRKFCYCSFAKFRKANVKKNLTSYYCEII